MTHAYEPRREDRFTCGLWCTAYAGREVFGREVRAPLDPIENIRGLARAGCYGFNFHDDDLVPFGASLAERNEVVKRAKAVMREEGIINAMVTCNMFEHPVFKDGALTSNDARIRAYALQKAMKAIDLGAELGATIYVMWGGREGLEVEASKDPRDAIKRYRDGVEFLAHYILDNRYGMRVAMEPKPNEPRGDIFLATAGHVLGFIATLDPAVRPIVGVNPEIQHSRMAGLNTVHELAQCLEAGKLFHCDLGAQKPTRYDQDLRFGSEDMKETFFIVHLLESSGWDGTRAFDVKPYRQDRIEDVWDLVRGCIRSYLILRERAKRFDADAEIQQLRRDLQVEDGDLAALAKWSPANARVLRERRFDPDELARRRLNYQRLDQLVFELLAGVR
ncbi:MAG TPA: xylose isomerase [Candidatus Dormibacteraeota bacterium]|nr:xylose isomerase [Candidatus Dormibacteraeota bacterium]